MTFESITGILRHLLTAGAGILVTDGVIQQSQSEQFVATGLFLAGIAWSLLNKYLHKQALTSK